MNDICKIYKTLYKIYGPQGWWPFLNYDSKNNLNSKNIYNYHINDYTFPKSSNQIFEVCLGSILTQNTTFSSVVKALKNLYVIDCLTPEKIQATNIEKFKKAIKVSGYYNQKSNYIMAFIKFYNSLDSKIPTRKELLNIKGIGEETADSILLYGYNQTEFKVDAYTKRIFLELNLINKKAKYKDIKKLAEDSLQEITKDKEELRIIYQEFHALIVKHAKQFYSKKPYGVGCILKKINLNYIFIQ